ncbi:Uncharacterised protein, partial [Mycoplasmoides gallisepticum]
MPENPAEGEELALQKAFSPGNTSNFPGSFSYLISSETTGEINYDANTRTRTSNLTGTYKLEGAKGVKLYDANDKLLAVVLRPTTGTGAEMW